MIANPHQREVRLEFVLIELHSGRGDSGANPLREGDELLLRLRPDPPDPRVTAIREEAASSEARLEPAAAVDFDAIHHRLILLAEKSERQMLRFGPHP